MLRVQVVHVPATHDPLIFLVALIHPPSNVPTGRSMILDSRDPATSGQSPMPVSNATCIYIYNSRGIHCFSKQLPVKYIPPGRHVFVPLLPATYLSVTNSVQFCVPYSAMSTLVPAKYFPCLNR